MQMLIAALNGSPQKEGNTATLLQKALEIAGEQNVETKLIHVAEALKGIKVPFCYQCSTPCNGNCSRNNKLGEAFDVLRSADAVIVGSPVYFGTVSGQLKAFWDKTRILRKEKVLLNVPGFAVSVGTSRFGGQETTMAALQQMMLVQGMSIVGDGYNENDCGHFGVCAQQPVEKDVEVWKRMPIAVKRLLEVAEITMELKNSRKD